MRIYTIPCLLVMLWPPGVFNHPVQRNEEPVNCSNKAVDLVFAVDSSVSIRPDEIQQVLAFMRAVVDQLIIGPDRFRVGVFSFGSDVRLEIKLDQFDNGWDLKKAISKIEHMASGTDTWEAIEFARKEMFTNAYGARQWAKKQLVLITDGYSHNMSRTVSEAAVARSLGIEIFSVGVKIAEQDSFEAVHVASDPKSSHVFKVGDFKALEAISSSVGGAGCDGFVSDGPSYERETDEDIAFPDRDQLILPGCNKTKADVLFLLDSSSSIWEPDFKRQKNFIQEVTKKLDIGPDTTRIGVVTFSDTPVTIVSFDAKQTQEHIQEVLNKAPYITGTTKTALVLNFARLQGFAEARPYVARIVILLTDGDSSDAKKAVAEARRLKRNGVAVFVIGVNDELNVKHIQEMASKPAKQFVFNAKNSHKLKEISHSVAEKTCKEAVKLTKKPPPAQCPAAPSDVVFLYDTSALSRQHKNLVIRIISSVTTSHNLNKRKALRIGVVRNANSPDSGFHTQTRHHHHQQDQQQLLQQQHDDYSSISTSDIELTADWTKAAKFQHLLDPDPTSADADLLLRKVRQSYFLSDDWLPPQEKGRRKFIVLFIDSPLSEKHAAKLEASRLQNLGVKIAVVAVGGDYSKNEVLSLASEPAGKHVFKPTGRGKSRVRRMVRAILNILCH